MARAADPTTNYLRHRLTQADAVTSIRTFADYETAYVACSELDTVYYVKGTDITPHQQRLLSKVNHSFDRLEELLADAFVDPVFQEQCFCTLAVRAGVEYTADVPPSEHVIFEVIDRDYAISRCIRACLKVFDTLPETESGKVVVQTPLFVYNALQAALAQEAHAVGGAQAMVLGLPFSIPSASTLAAALLLWQDADTDSPYCRFSDALQAALTV